MPAAQLIATKLNIPSLRSGLIRRPKLFRLLDAPGRANMTLTESFAMLPTASVSGYYFSHPESVYFSVFIRP